MRNLPGTYALIMTCDSDQRVQIGKLGQLCARPGFYVYVGSAFGPGGLKARIAHHTKIARHPHWHIDYLRPICHLKHIWYSYESKKHEHRWAGALSRFERATIPLAGFGASDCSCPSHLFRFSRKPSIRLFHDKWQCHIKDYCKQPDPNDVN
ncbi:MAG: GIY-YIG nuclease family protein [Desulfobacterales bacterium]|jgi:Uri superfamily endonuclease